METLSDNAITALGLMRVPSELTVLGLSILVMNPNVERLPAPYCQLLSSHVALKSSRRA